jgi:hypothetical protein
MRKILKNPSTTEYIRVESVGLILAPQDMYELTGTDKLDWIFNEDILSHIRNDKLQVGSWEDFFYDKYEGELWYRTEFEETAFVLSGTDIVSYAGGVVTDSISGKKSTSLFMNILTLMKEFYNSLDSPIYDPNFQKFVGTGGREVEHLARTTNLEAQVGVSCAMRARPSATQNISINVATKVNFATEDYDYGSGWNTTNSRYTYPATTAKVLFDVTCKVLLSGTATGYISVYKNGSFYCKLSESSSSIISYGGSTNMYLTDNDYIEIFVYIGTARTIQVANTYLDISSIM